MAVADGAGLCGLDDGPLWVDPSLAFCNATGASASAGGVGVGAGSGGDVVTVAYRNFMRAWYGLAAWKLRPQQGQSQADDSGSGSSGGAGSSSSALDASVPSGGGPSLEVRESLSYQILQFRNELFITFGIYLMLLWLVPLLIMAWGKAKRIYAACVFREKKIAVHALKRAPSAPRPGATPGGSLSPSVSPVMVRSASEPLPPSFALGASAASASASSLASSGADDSKQPAASPDASTGAPTDAAPIVAAASATATATAVETPATAPLSVVPIGLRGVAMGRTIATLDRSVLSFAMGWLALSDLLTAQRVSRHWHDTISGADFLWNRLFIRMTQPLNDRINELAKATAAPGAGAADGADDAKDAAAAAAPAAAPGAAAAAGAGAAAPKQLTPAQAAQQRALFEQFRVMAALSKSLVIQDLRHSPAAPQTNATAANGATAAPVAAGAAAGVAAAGVPGATAAARPAVRPAVPPSPAATPMSAATPPVPSIERKASDSAAAPAPAPAPATAAAATADAGDGDGDDDGDSDGDGAGAGESDGVADDPVQAARALALPIPLSLPAALIPTKSKPSPSPSASSAVAATAKRRMRAPAPAPAATNPDNTAVAAASAAADTASGSSWASASADSKYGSVYPLQSAGAGTRTGSVTGGGGGGDGASDRKSDAATDPAAPASTTPAAAPSDTLHSDSKSAADRAGVSSAAGPDSAGATEAAPAALPLQHLRGKSAFVQGFILVREANRWLSEPRDGRSLEEAVTMGLRAAFFGFHIVHVLRFLRWAHFALAMAALLSGAAVRDLLWRTLKRGWGLGARWATAPAALLWGFGLYSAVLLLMSWHPTFVAAVPLMLVPALVLDALVSATGLTRPAFQTVLDRLIPANRILSVASEMDALCGPSTHWLWCWVVRFVSWPKWVAVADRFALQLSLVYAFVTFLAPIIAGLFLLRAWLAPAPAVAGVGGRGARIRLVLSATVNLVVWYWVLLALRGPVLAWIGPTCTAARAWTADAHNTIAAADAVVNGTLSTGASALSATAATAAAFTGIDTGSGVSLALPPPPAGLSDIPFGIPFVLTAEEVCDALETGLPAMWSLDLALLRTDLLALTADDVFGALQALSTLPLELTMELGGWLLPWLWWQLRVVLPFVLGAATPIVWFMQCAPEQVLFGTTGSVASRQQRLRWQTAVMALTALVTAVLYARWLQRLCARTLVLAALFVSPRMALAIAAMVLAVATKRQFNGMRADNTPDNAPAPAPAPAAAAAAAAAADGDADDGDDAAAAAANAAAAVDDAAAGAAAAAPVVAVPVRSLSSTARTAARAAVLEVFVRHRSFWLSTAALMSFRWLRAGGGGGLIGRAMVSASEAAGEWAVAWLPFESALLLLWMGASTRLLLDDTVVRTE